MDADRFDSLTRSLTAQLTRRRGLGLLGALGLGASVSAWDADARKKKGKKKKKKKPQPACKVNQGATGTTSTLAVKQGDLSLTTTERIPQNPGNALTSTTTIRQKGSLVMQTTMTFTGSGQTDIQIVYGKGFTGIERADLTTNGQTVSGTVDGRAIVPFSAAAAPEVFQFQDGQPAPETSASKEVAQGLERIFALAEAKAESCAPAEGRGRASGLSAQNHNSFQCLTCKAGCGGAFLYCGSKLKGVCAATAAACLFGAPLCFAACAVAGGAICVAAAVTCMGICARTVCCAVPCGDTGSTVTCCEDGQACLRPGVCCQAGQFPCHGQNCCPSSQRCMPNGTCCIAPDFPCGQSCCDRTLSCCNGVCCSGQCLGGVCCTPPSRRCGSGFSARCCANECCNNVCCAAGESCHPQTGQCAVLCPPNQDFCPTGGNGRCCNPLQSCCLSGSSWFCGPDGCVA